MLKFTSADDLARLPNDNPAYPVIATLIQGIITDTLDTEYPYDPDADGFIALLEGLGDVEKPLTDIWPSGDWYFTDIPFEGITRQDGMFLAIYLANNQYGIVFVLDSSWVQGELLEFIERNLDPPEEIQRQQSTFELEET